jgi:hypothetical protein
MILPEIDINRVLLCPTTTRTRTAINNLCDTLLDTTYCMYLALYESTFEGSRVLYVVVDM